jgi:cytochrome oxidase Cu insertion factor (SCO1/SenC/PrrC family)
MLTRRTLIAAAATLPALQALAQPATGIDRGQIFPNIRYRATDGRQHGVHDSRGKVTLLYFWASWCPVCAADLKNIQTVYQRYQGNPRFQMILLNFMDPYERGLRWAEQRGYMLPFRDSGIEGNQPLAMTEGGTYTLPRQTPLFFLLDANGVVLETTQHQTNDAATLARIIEEALRMS